jgi:2-polyprenyl-3-methyl-5-hydroxy-6-metoxy-1,4-benzoquinol methylase/uncharacterized protein (DUF2062 family)
MSGESESRPRREPLRAQVRRAWSRLRGGELTPERAFWSVALGIFVGVQPTPGIHFFVVVAVCVPLRLDAALSYVAANISIPPLAPFLWFASIQIGSRILTGHFAPLTVEGMHALVRAPGPLLGALALGSIVLGASLGLVGGGIAYAVARARRRPAEDAASRTADRFRRAGAGRGPYHYARAKLRSDPVTRELALRAPLGEVLDLGCGRGQLAIFLLEAAAATRVRGSDWDEKKVALARRAAEGLDASFERQDLREGSGGAEPADTVLLVDVLHYLDAAAQDALLARAAKLVRPGGRLFVRDASRGLGARSTLTLAFERIGTALRVNRGERVLFRDVARELVPQLEALGMKCEVVPCYRGTPFANVLLVATR